MYMFLVFGFVFGDGRRGVDVHIWKILSTQKLVNTQMFQEFIKEERKINETNRKIRNNNCPKRKICTG